VEWWYCPHVRNGYYEFVYRRSWQANTITIKAFERDSIKINEIN